MIILFYLTSGLFLGWSLGANDAANVFGTAVGTRMLRFKTAAIVASIFVIIGTVLQGEGANATLGKLGNVSVIAAAFTVALSAAISVYLMIRLGLPASTSQAIVGAIIGWNFYTHNPTDINILSKIVSAWLLGPLMGGLFSILLFMLTKFLIKSVKIHLLFRESLIRYGLLIVGAFAAYSLGANNIANVMGVFTGAIHLEEVDLGFIQFDSTQQLFFIGGIAIAVGIITYSKRMMVTIGRTIMPLTPEAAIVVVLSQALVLFIFSSQALHDGLTAVGLPAFPLVPVSSSQVVIGAIFGIGIYKGGKQIKYKILGSIGLGWLSTPITAGFIAFFLLFFVNNVFKQDVGFSVVNVTLHKKAASTQVLSNEPIDTIQFHDRQVETVNDSVVPGFSVKLKNLTQQRYLWRVLFWSGISTLLVAICVLLYINMKQKNKLKQLKYQIKSLENKYSLKINQLEKSLEDKIHRQQDLGKELKFRQNEMVTMAMNIIHKNEFLNSLKDEIVNIKAGVHDHETRQGLIKLSLMITQDLSIDRDREKFQMHINEQNSHFIHKLTESFPTITENEKRLASLLRLNLSSKEIASILNISPKSVEMNRYRLRKKLKVNPKINLNDFIREI